MELHETGGQMSPMDGDEPMSRSVRTRRSAAIAGAPFAILLAATLALIRLATPSDAGDVDAWLNDPAASGSGSMSRSSADVMRVSLFPWAVDAFHPRPAASNFL